MQELTLEMTEGTDFGLVVTWKDENGDPVDVTGYSASFRVGNSSGTELEITEASGITVGGVDGTFGIGLTAEQTDDLLSRNYDFDVIDADGAVTRLLTGKIEMTKRKVQP